MVEKLEGQADSVQGSSSAVMSTNLVINVALSGSLAMLWGLINSLQIIAHMPLLVIKFPINANVFYQMLLTLATFDILPTDMVSDMMKEWLGNDSNEEEEEFLNTELS